MFRRRLGFLIGPIAGSLMAFGFVALGSPAAALDAPAPWVVAGNAQFTAEWAKVVGATSYQVEYATNSSFSGAKKIPTSTIRKSATSLKNGTTYYVRVRAYDAAGGSSLSSRKTVVPSSHKPAKATGVKVSGAGTSYPDHVNVSWSLPPYATKVKVFVTRDNAFLPSDGPVSGKYISVDAAASQRSARVDLKVMTNWEDIAGSRTANAVYARVKVYNGSSTSQSSIEFGYASPPTPPSGSPVKIADWNIQSIVNDAYLPSKWFWLNRLPAVKRSIRLADPDVLTVQEVTNAKGPKGDDKIPEGQLRRLDATLADRGYFPDPYERADDEGTLCKPVVNGVRYPDDISKDGHIYYRPSVMKVVEVDEGGGRPVRQCGIHALSASNIVSDWPGDVQDNYFAWAEFELKDASKARFFVVSMHPRKGTTEAQQQMRIDVADGVHKFIKGLPSGDGAAAPIVVMGDMNSDVGRYPQGITTRFMMLGYTEAAATLGRTAVYGSSAEKKYVHFGTSNNQGENASYEGYPPEPFYYAYEGTRIDHIMLLRTGATFFENQIELETDGDFDTDYQGSDHNLQKATINIPALVTGP